MLPEIHCSFPTISAHDACRTTDSAQVVCQSAYATVSTFGWVGPMKALSMGAIHACGIRPDGSLRCWNGRSVVEESMPSTARGASDMIPSSGLQPR